MEKLQWYIDSLEQHRLDDTHSFLETLEAEKQGFFFDKNRNREEFFDKRNECIHEIYGIFIKEENHSKKDLFQWIDRLEDKILHITPYIIGVYQVYIYIKTKFCVSFFKNYQLPRQEFIHSIKFRDYFSLERFHKTRTIYCKTDYIHSSFNDWLRQQSSIDDKIVLITGSSDFPITDAIVKNYSKNIAYWFGTNVTSSVDYVQGIPLGLTSYDPRATSPSFLYQYGDLSDYHKILANDDCICNAWTLPKTNEWPIYMNFSVGTFYDRVRVWNTFSQHPLVTAKSHTTTLDARTDFFKDMRRAMSSLCPRGNGIDTHRFWESLYSGVVPIIEHDKVYTFFEGLPYIALDKLDLNNIPEDSSFSLEIQSKLQNMPLNYHKLYVSYWIEQIERKSVLVTEKE
jgi:hypothetical protein